MMKRESRSHVGEDDASRLALSDIERSLSPVGDWPTVTQFINPYQTQQVYVSTLQTHVAFPHTPVPHFESPFFFHFMPKI